MTNTNGLPRFKGGYWLLLTDTTNQEIVYVTERNGKTITIIRAQCGTTAQSWLTDVYIKVFEPQRLVAGANIDLVYDPVTDATTISSSGGSGISDGVYSQITVSGSGTALDLNDEGTAYIRTMVSMRI